MIALDRTRAALVAALGLAFGPAACGDDARYSAEEFVAEVNAEGAGLELGAPLDSTREGATPYEIDFDHGAEDGGGGHAHGGGTLVIAESDDAGLAEYERCEAAATLVCLRAANAALYFEGAPAPAELARLEAALGSLASD